MGDKPKPNSMLNDPRPIRDISWGETYGDAWWRLGRPVDGEEEGLITEIVVYPENGLPWVAIYIGEKLAVRADCKGAQIRYE